MRTPLHEITARRGAQFRDDHGWQVPDHYGDAPGEYRVLKEGAGLVDLSGRGKIAARGEDRIRWMNGMVTNDVKNLQPGQGVYCFVLNNQGHILADLHVLAQVEHLLLDCEPFLTERLLTALDHYIIMDQVELADSTSRLGTVAVAGPQAAAVLRSALGLLALPQNPLDHVAWGDQSLVLRVLGDFWLMAPRPEWPALWERLEASGAAAVGFQAWETCRIEAGIPRHGVDIHENTLPQETGQMRALSFTKGCYIGQEIVERIRSRGHVNRLLVGLEAAHANLRSGAKVEVEGREIGQVTSATWSPSLERAIALAYLRREFTEPGTKVIVEGHPAEVRALPFMEART